jgi:serine/threonine protein kinase
MPLTPERWQQIARIYELVIDRDPATREAALSEACAGDDALRQQAESLLGQEAVEVLVDRPVWAAAAPLFNGPDLRAATLGPYHIEGPLGSGGMGEVFHATDSRLNRRVAIKVLHSGAAVDPQMRARFAREAQAVASLTHPHIYTLYDIGRHDQVDFLVMEYLEGQTLATRLEGGPLPPDEALTRAIEIASALDHAHRHGIIHRDLKPGNIMLTASGAKLLDFGLAKFRRVGDHAVVEADETRPETRAGATDYEPIEDDDRQMTNRGAILGTVRYMSPEQIEAREVDARSDLFAFGAMLYEMLTGTRAFDGDDATSVRTAILEHAPPRVSSIQPSVPAVVDDIVQRCLAKDPDERWQTASGVLRELKRGSEAITPVPVRRSAWRWGSIPPVRRRSSRKGLKLGTVLSAYPDEARLRLRSGRRRHVRQTCDLRADRSVRPDAHVGQHRPNPNHATRRPSRQRELRSGRGPASRGRPPGHRTVP